MWGRLVAWMNSPVSDAAGAVMGLAALLGLVVLLALWLAVGWKVLF